jgi:hypothetical protein
LPRPLSPSFTTLDCPQSTEMRILTSRSSITEVSFHRDLRDPIITDVSPSSVTSEYSVAQFPPSFACFQPPSRWQVR